MKLYVLTIVGFMVGTISYFHSNLEYKNTGVAHACYGECYEEYVKIHGTPAEIEQRKKAAAEGDPFASIRSLWAGCAACHGQNGEGMAVFPALAGQSSDYIVGRLNAYRNKEEIGGMSSTMWSQAAMLSDDEINLIGKFVQTELK
jgi:cytochrome c553